MPHHHGAGAAMPDMTMPGAAMPGMAMPPTDYAAAPAAERPFLQGNDAAMAKMMADMTVKPTGDIDRDFVDMMVPHHQGAIDMAEMLPRSEEQTSALQSLMRISYAVLLLKRKT